MSDKSSDDERVESPEEQKRAESDAEAKAEHRSDGEKEEAPEKNGTASPDPDREAKPKEDDDNGDDGEEARKRRGDPGKGDAQALVDELLKRPSAKKADNRGRRLLGSMMGHLVSARSRLKEEGLLDPKNRRLMQAKEDRAVREKETAFLERRLERHYTSMKNFIRTRAEPTIFYLPKRQTPRTERSLEETRCAIDAKIKALKVQLRVGPFDAELADAGKMDDVENGIKEAPREDADDGDAEGGDQVNGIAPQNTEEGEKANASEGEDREDKDGKEEKEEKSVKGDKDDDEKDDKDSDADRSEKREKRSRNRSPDREESQDGSASSDEKSSKRRK